MPSTSSGTESNTLIGRSRNHRWRNKNVPSTGSGTESSSKYKAVIEGGEITEMMSENVPSTGSATVLLPMPEPVEATQ